MKKNVNKILVVALAISLLALAVVAGTLAYLIAPQQTLTNTFTVGEGVTITLTETKPTGNTVDFLPGETGIEKDPVITVTGRECWVFVTVKVTEGIEEYIDYTIDDIWTQTVVAEATADGFTTITYGTTAASAADAVLHILEGDTVDYNDVDAMPAGDLTMTFTAYAIQTSENWDNAADAWAQLQIELTPAP